MGGVVLIYDFSRIHLYNYLYLLLYREPDVYIDSIMRIDWAAGYIFESLLYLVCLIYELFSINSTKESH